MDDGEKRAKFESAREGGEESPHAFNTAMQPSFKKSGLVIRNRRSPHVFQSLDGAQATIG